MEFTYDVTMFQDTFEHEFTYLNGFLRNVSKNGDQPAMVCPLTGRKWNYAQLNEDCNRLAHAMKAGGVAKNDVVMYMLLNLHYLLLNMVKILSMCLMNKKEMSI